MEGQKREEKGGRERKKGGRIKQSLSWTQPLSGSGLKSHVSQALVSSW